MNHTWLYIRRSNATGLGMDLTFNGCGTDCHYGWHTQVRLFIDRCASHFYVEWTSLAHPLPPIVTLLLRMSKDMLMTTGDIEFLWPCRVQSTYVQLVTLRKAQFSKFQLTIVTRNLAIHSPFTTAPLYNVELKPVPLQDKRET